MYDIELKSKWLLIKCDIRITHGAYPMVLICNGHVPVDYLKCIVFIIFFLLV